MRKLDKVFCLYFQNDTMGTEAALAFEKIGLTVIHEKLPVTQEGRVSWAPVAILKRVILEKPQVVFIVNVFGVDPACDILRAFSLLGVQTALWFIDNPFYFFDHLNALRSLNNVFSFVWDRFYVLPLKSFGIPEVHHLPQATNPERFFEQPLKKEDEKRFKHPIVFAGNLDFALLQESIQDWELQYPHLRDFLKDSLTEVSVEILKHPKIPSWECVQRVIEKKRIPTDQMSERALHGFTRIAEGKLSILMRMEMVKTLSDFDLALWGDAEGWGNAGVSAKILGRVSYFQNMPKVVNGSGISLNVSRVQQRFGTNQRVFDVPASKCFLLTDHKEELEELFEPGRDLITYKNFDDLREKLVFYRDHEDSRRKISELGCHTVLSRHTYGHRMKTVLEALSSVECAPEEAFLPQNKKASDWILEARKVKG